MSFVDSSTLTTLPSLDQSQADALDFGIVKVDDEGNVLLYNQWESDMAGVPVASAMGKNFFTQVAPCTNNRLFFGRFKDGVSAGDLDTEFNYTVTYKMKPTTVVVRLLRDGSSANWVFVAKRSV